MHSPLSHSPQSSHLDPQVASCIKEGIFCGQALDNVFNMADAPDLQNFDGLGFHPPLQGKVLLFNSYDTEAEPIMLINHVVTPDLRPVLKKIAD